MLILVIQKGPSYVTLSRTWPHNCSQAASLQRRGPVSQHDVDNRVTDALKTQQDEPPDDRNSGK